MYRLARAKQLLLLVVAGTLGLAFASSGSTAVPPRETLVPVVSSRLPIQGEGGIAASEQDFTGELVPVLERDTIPSLDFPPYIDASSADSTLRHDEFVLGVVIGADARAYPLRVMASHEVVNDEINGVPVVVTFCPLCFTGVAYDRRVEGETRMFGVSGFLLNSSLVMFDRERESLWSQVTGVALSGQDEGATLTRISATQTDYGSWLAAYPETRVPDIEALGGDDRYPVERFESYFSSSTAGLVPLTVRGDIAQKAVIAGIQVNDVASAFELPEQRSNVLNVEIGDESVIVWLDGRTSTARAYLNPADNPVSIDQGERRAPELVDTFTGQRWSALTGGSVNRGHNLESLDVTMAFWFGWSAFFPETMLWEAEP